MKLDFPHKVGDIIPIYKDWENEQELLGTAKLVRFHRQGRSFILEDTYPEVDQIVYNYQEWEVSWTKPSNYPDNCNYSKFTTEKIRYVDTIGIANSSDDEDYDAELDKLPKDSFLKWQGVEIF